MRNNTGALLLMPKKKEDAGGPPKRDRVQIALPTELVDAAEPYLKRSMTTFSAFAREAVIEKLEKLGLWPLVEEGADESE